MTVRVGRVPLAGVVVGYPRGMNAAANHVHSSILANSEQVHPFQD